MTTHEEENPLSDREQPRIGTGFTLPFQGLPTFAESLLRIIESKKTWEQIKAYS